MKNYDVWVLIDENFSSRKRITSELSKDEVLREFMIGVVSSHVLDTPSTATFEFEIREVR
jgi:hypothetical protein